MPGLSEWRTIVELSGDQLAIDEILEDRDFHSENQKRFGLPSRLIAKIFLFRWIFLGSAYAYSLDPAFAPIGGKDYWQKIIDEFNKKYEGISGWHQKMIREAKTTGKVLNPITGRTYLHEPKITKYGVKWNESDIVNYPVQGIGADIAAVVRIMAKERIIEQGMQEDALLLFPVHDSLVADCSWKGRAWYKYVEILESCIQDLPERFLKEYGYHLKVPHKLEHEVGIRYGWMHPIQPLKSK